MHISDNRLPDRQQTTAETQTDGCLAVGWPCRLPTPKKQQASVRACVSVSWLFAIAPWLFLWLMERSISSLKPAAASRNAFPKPPPHPPAKHARGQHLVGPVLKLGAQARRHTPSPGREDATLDKSARRRLPPAVLPRPGSNLPQRLLSCRCYCICTASAVSVNGLLPCLLFRPAEPRTVGERSLPWPATAAAYARLGAPRALRCVGIYLP
ncbi:hypothetical protein B0T19DRAFT_245221 [Cercophora scortea]|uniref:Uncharacterized protein n=1 Tax=Cercophora scortea TaxID=314031 RepID=A0AAE0I8Z4_9PEZI|nr:hypothetical protein B0T19DRAFT_245221 [Cercophora scortea]